MTFLRDLKKKQSENIANLSEQISILKLEHNNLKDQLVDQKTIQNELSILRKMEVQKCIENKHLSCKISAELKKSSEQESILCEKSQEIQNLYGQISEHKLELNNLKKKLLDQNNIHNELILLRESEALKCKENEKFEQKADWELLLQQKCQEIENLCGQISELKVELNNLKEQLLDQNNLQNELFLLRKSENEKCKENESITQKLSVEQRKFTEQASILSEKSQEIENLYVQISELKIELKNLKEQLLDQKNKEVIPKNSNEIINLTAKLGKMDEELKHQQEKYFEQNKLLKIRTDLINCYQDSEHSLKNQIFNLHTELKKKSDLIQVADNVSQIN